ncbi:MAG: hypothetical protein Ctma_0337 [Catillopecten margaritatus gill symbiont]|uniref:Outer membrane protein beta-barrel domain-containing protein n=1 Tax=Catillopecten margaritatus gill symbiont TaxID=3083288 RepID=A0AAU6PF70_9GAMM
MLKITLTSVFLIAFQAQAQEEKTLKHGFYLSEGIGSINNADISGTHNDYENFTGSNFQDITQANATVHDGKISTARSLGYNLRYTPKVGFGYELGLYVTELRMPQQNAALIHDDGSAFKKNTATGPVNHEVDSPSSYIKTTDLYLGGLYNFAEVNKMTPYVGLGYAKVKGDWHRSYYNPADLNNYGEKGKTKINGHYVSAKVGLIFKEKYSIELEHAKHKLHADAFRSFNINGSDAKFSRTSLNLIVNF